MTEKLQLSAESSDIIIDDVTVREVLPSGKLGPNILTDDFEGWESNQPMQPTLYCTVDQHIQLAKHNISMCPECGGSTGG